MPKQKVTKEKVKCTCGNEFEKYIYPYNSNPYDYMCPDCVKKDGLRYATRMLKLEKFRCVKCSWKLKEKDVTGIDENLLWFKCKCCGYRFALWFPDPYDDYY